jgi:hypothetical protein
MSEIELLEQKISELRDDILTNPNNKDKKSIILKAIKFLLTKIPEAKEKDRIAERKRIEEERERIQAPIREKKAKDATAVKGLKEIAGNAKKLLDDIETKKRMVDFYLTRSINSNSGKDMLKLMYDEALKELDKYDEVVSKVPNYPQAEVQSFKDEVAQKLEKLKYKIIYDLLKEINEYKKQIANPTKYAGGGDNETAKGIKKRDEFVKKSNEKKKELSDLIRSRFSSEEQRKAIELGKKSDSKNDIIRQHRNLIDDIKGRNYLDEKRGEKNEYGNPIGYLLENRYYEPPYWDSPNVEKEREKFKKEQAKRIAEYNASPLGKKEKEEIAANLASIENKRQEALQLEKQYDFLPKKAATTSIYSIYNKYNPETFGKGIDNPELYETAKKIADETYDKPSAYKSGFIVKKYKELGGTYSGKKENKGIGRWFKEDWKDIGGKEYPVYRPTKRVSKDTPLTASEIDPIQAKKQIKLKQIIKGDANLPKFEEKQGSGIEEFSNPKQVMKNAKKYLGKDVVLELSNKKDKKYMVYNPNTKKWVYFGQIGYEDFTKHKDPKRRENYLTRTANMKGNWKDDKYSPNNLSRNLLW